MNAENMIRGAVGSAFLIAVCLIVLAQFATNPNPYVSGTANKTIESINILDAFGSVIDWLKWVLLFAAAVVVLIIKFYPKNE